MSDNDETRNKHKSRDEERKRRYVIKDAVGKRHTFIAGEDGMTEEWIAILRHDENELFTSNYRYYFRWNGKEYVPAVLRSDLVDPEDLERYPSMIDPEKSAEALLIEREERANFMRRFNAAMRSLTEGQWKLIQKRCQLGLSDAAIARQEGVDPTAIRNRWKRIRKKIKKFFE